MVRHLRFFFCWILSRCPLCTTWGSCASVAPPISWGPQARSLLASLLFSGLHSVSFTWFKVFVGGSTPSSLCVLRHACLACTWRSLASFLSAFRAPPGAITQLSPSLVWSYFPGDLHCLANRLVRSFFLNTWLASSRHLQNLTGSILQPYSFLSVVITYA